MRRLLLLVICVLMGCCLAAQTVVTKKSGTQNETVNSQIDTTKNKNANTDKTQIEQAQIEQSQQEDVQQDDVQPEYIQQEYVQQDDSIWKLFVKQAKVKGKRKIKRMQIGVDRPGEDWKVVGKVVDTMGNPIEGVEVRSLYVDFDDKFYSEFKTEKDGTYIVKSEKLITNRVFKKKGYRVAGEVRPGTKVFAFHCYTRPNPIVMVPIDYSGDETKYDEGVKMLDPPDLFGSADVWRIYYEFEDLTFMEYIKRYNIMSVKGTVVSVNNNLGKTILIDSLDYVYQKEKEERIKRREIERSNRIYNRVQKREAKREQNKETE